MEPDLAPAGPGELFLVAMGTVERNKRFTLPDKT
jgi:hypothetical protein